MKCHKPAGNTRRLERERERERERRTSGYAMVVHGRPKPLKIEVFWGVTQPPGVTQPLYSRGHN